MIDGSADKVLNARLLINDAGTAAGPDDIGRHLLDPQLPLLALSAPATHTEVAIDPKLYDAYNPSNIARVLSVTWRLKLSTSVESAHRTCQSYFLNDWPNWLTEPP